MLRTPQKGNQQGQCPRKKGITPNKGHHTTAHFSPAPAPGPPGRMYSGRGGYRTEEQETGERRGGRGRALVPSQRGVHLKGMQCSPGACVAGGPEAETTALGCKVRRRTRRCRCPSHPPPLYIRVPFLPGSLRPGLASSPRTAPSGHTSLLKVKPGLARLDGAGVWTREGRSPSSPEPAQSLLRLRNLPTAPDTLFLLGIKKACGAVFYLSLYLAPL